MTARIIISILLNAVWMPVLIAAAAYLLLKIVRNASAATRYGVLTVALFAALLLPVVTSLWTYRAEPAAERAPARVTTFAAVPHKHIAPPLKIETAHANVTAAHSTPAPHHWALPQLRLSIPQQIALAVAIIWALFAAGLLLRLAVSFAYLERLKRDALPLGMEYRGQLRRWSEARPDQNVRLCVSEETIVPVAVGWFDAMVLIPRHLIDELEPNDLDRIILHEIAHLRRGDSFVNTVQRIGTALFFFSPGLAWIGRQLDLEREVACDDWVVERGADAAPYANCLLRLAERTPWPHKALATPGAFITRKSMSIRIERILHKTRNVRLRPAPGPLAAAFAAVAGVALAGFWLSPSIAYPLQPETSATRVRVTAPLAHVRQTPHQRVVERSSVRTRVIEPAPDRATTATKQTKVRQIEIVKKPESVKTRVVASTRITRSAPKATLQRSAPSELLTAPAPVENPVVVAAASPTSGDDYIAQMRALFGQNISVNELIELKSMGITADYVQQLRSAGFPNLTAREAVEAKSMGITASRVNDLRAAWGKNLSLREMVTLVSVGVDRAYAQSMQSAGLGQLTVNQLVELKSVGVSPEYIRQANALGFGKLNASQLVEMKSMGIDAAYVQKVRQHGFNNLTVNQLIELKSSGLIQ